MYFGKRLFTSFSLAILVSTVVSFQLPLAPSRQIQHDAIVRLYQAVKDKPTRQEIEKAAGQREAQVKTPGMGSVR